MAFRGGQQNLMEALLRFQDPNAPGFVAPGGFDVSAQSETPTIDPNAIDPIALGVQARKLQRDQGLAEAMMSQGYTPNSGPLGILAPVLGAVLGSRMQRQGDEKLSDLVGKYGQYRQQADAVKFAREQQQEKDKAQREMDQMLAKMRAEQEFKAAHPEGYNLGPGQQHFEGGKMVASVPTAPKEYKPTEFEQKVALAKQLGIPLNSLVTGGGPGAELAPPGDPNLKGADYLKTLTPAMADQVKALAEGRIPFPTGYAMRSPQALQLRAAALQYDPELNAQDFNSRYAARKDITSGMGSRNVKSLNTALGHLGQLQSQIGDVAGHEMPLIGQTVNSLENAYQQQSGNPGITNFNQTAGALGAELASVFKGTGASAETEVKRNIEMLSPDASEAQKKAAIKNIAGLLHSRLQAVGDTYSKGMGRIQDPFSLLDPKAAALLKSFEGDQSSPSGVDPSISALVEHYRSK